MGIKFSNLASTTLASSVTSSATSITVADGSVFPTLGAGDYFYATIDAPPSLTEIVKVTARSGNTLTVVRAQDNTTATTHASGDEIALRVVSAVLEDIASAAATESVSISGDTMTGDLTVDGDVTADNYLTSGYLALSAPSTANNYALVDINDSTFDFQLRQYNGSSWVTSLTIDQVNQFATFSAGASFAGSLGVGTTTPDTIFEIRGADPVLTIRDTETASASGNATLRLAESGASDTLNNYWDIKSTGGKFQIIDNWDEGAGTGTRLTIDDGGNVGINTTPAYRLDVDSAIHIGADGGSGYTHSRLIFDSNGSTRGAGAYFHNRVNDVEYFAGNPYNDADTFAITRQATASHAESTATYTNALMTIDGATGYMGIGTTNPVNVIDLGLATNGRGIAWGGGGSAHYASIWTEYGTASMILGAGLKGGTDAATFLNPYTGSYGYAAIELDSFSDEGIKFYVAPDSSRTINEAITPVEVMRIRTGGDVLIGTTTQVYGSARLNIGSTSDATNAIQIQNSTSGNGYVMFGDGTSSNAYRGYIHYNHGSDYLRLRAAGSERLRCDSGGVNVYGDLVTDGELYFDTSLRVGLELTGTATATVGPGWMTVATNTSGRRHGEIIVTDADSGDHGFIRIDWIRSYADSNFTVLNCGGHSNRITGARVISQDSNNTYGTKLLQVYVSTSSTYDVALFHHHGGADYTQHSAITPVIENTKTGYSVHGGQIEDLDDYSFASEEGIQSPQMRTGAIYANTTVSNHITLEPGGSDGYVDLKYGGNNSRLTTGSSGVTVTGDVEGVSNMYIGGYLYHDGDTNTYLRFVAADDMQLVAGGRQMLRMDEGANPDILKFVVGTTYTDSSGNIVASGNITAYASDERLKTNIRPIENAIDKIKAIRGVHYDWIDDVEDVGFIPDRKLDNVGVIAQEIEEVLPQVVKPAPFDRERSKETNWEFVSKSGEEYKTVDYDKITALLIQGMKEQQELIEALEAKIEKLEGELL